MKTGCLKISLIKIIIIFSIFALFDVEIYSQTSPVVKQEKNDTYLRINLYTGRDQIRFSKSSNIILIKTLNAELYQSLKKELSDLSFDKKYIQGIQYLDSKEGSFNIEISLANEHIEMFSFYREKEKKVVIDLWVDGDNVTLSKSAIQKPVIEKKDENKKVVEQINQDKKLAQIINWDDKNDKQSKNNKEEMAYRDQRYGATFVWDYDPIIPSVKALVNLSSKVPEELFPIPNRDISKSEMEAHLQLVINLYRKKKWGLMYKSIKLYKEKYGEKNNDDLIEFIKVNALLRENIANNNPEIYRNAIYMLNNIVEHTSNYEMQKAILKYLLSYYIEKGDTLKIFQLSKQFYSRARDTFDFEEANVPVELMLNSLAKMGQLSQINELSLDKNIQKAIPRQTILAYMTYISLKKNEPNEVVKIYEKYKTSFVQGISPVILYNSAESYFRLGKFNEAAQLFQKFVDEYSYEFVSSNALVRLALCSDYLEKNNSEVEEKYKKAVDLTIDPAVNYEARLRYVGFRSIRKNHLSTEDKEIRVLLDRDSDTKKLMTKNLEKLLYQVRLRSLIVDEAYSDAMTYLSAIPMNNFSNIEVRSFQGDGAEIVYGLIQEQYKNSKYADLIKTWQKYKDKYVDKVALDPYMNFLVGSSFVKLGMFKGFDEVYGQFKQLKDEVKRTFPIWVSRNNTESVANLLLELEVVKDIKLLNWDLVQKNLAKIEKSRPKYNMVNYYLAVMLFAQKQYKSATLAFENFFSHEEHRNLFDQNDLADLIRSYTDSIYELKDVDKYLRVGNALIGDTKNIGTENAYIHSVKERVQYLSLEILNQKKESSINLNFLEEKAKAFKVKYPDSKYLGRINYIMAVKYLNANKTKEGKQLLQEILSDKTTADYIKELAKSELSLVNVKEKTL